ncbi:hypothetical protein K439DRAFT_580371 [Ramaria rubella]|nr:hypothetical protein K439DRAFT_580371 [Ramaria rubella]
MDVFGDIDDRLSESPSAHNFQFPLEGSYLSETENGIPTSLLNEKTLDPEDTEVTLVRILKNFFIVDAVTRDLVSLSCLWESNEPCEAFGFAVADADEDEDEVDAREFEPDDGIFFRTSTILTYSLDIYRDSIWVRTQYSWYILGAPASIYSALFLPFYRKEMLLRLVLRCILKDRKTTEADFLLELASPEAKDPLLGRCWNKSDFLSCQYTLTELSDIVVAIPEPKIDWNSIKKAPLIVLLQEPFNAEDDILSEHSATPPPSRLPLRPVQIVPPPRKRKQKQKKPVKEASSTITPTVNALIASLFDCTFTIVGESPLFLKEELLVREQPQTQPFKSTTKYKIS